VSNELTQMRTFVGTPREQHRVGHRERRQALVHDPGERLDAGAGQIALELHRLVDRSGLWKRYQSRVLGVDWQEGFFDHLMRSAESYAEKWEYVRQNPVREKLCEQTEAWPYQGEIVPFRF
jgi:hypothetical protein